MNCPECRERCLRGGGIDPVFSGTRNGRFLESICYACPNFNREEQDKMRWGEYISTGRKPLEKPKSHVKINKPSEIPSIQTVEL